MDTYTTDRRYRGESAQGKPPSYEEVAKGPRKPVKRGDSTNESQHINQHEGIKNLFQKVLRNGKDPDRPSVENILLLGLSGAGKSALLCTLNAALIGRYIPWMRQGRGDAQTNTVELRRFERCGIRECDVEGHKNKQLLRALLPILPHCWDYAGIGNENSAAVREVIYLITHGFIPPGTNCRYLDKLQKDNTPDEDVLRMRYGEQHPEWKITTVVFVHSCQVVVPKLLINCLLSVLNEIDPDSGTSLYKGDVFVVMTKTDLADKPIIDRDGEENTHGRSSDGHEQLVDTSSEADVGEVERQLAAEFNIQGSQTFTSMKLTNYSDDSGYDYNPEIVRQHLQFLYLITLPKHRIEELGSSTTIKMKFKLWVRRAKREITQILNGLDLSRVCLFMTVIVAIVWLMMSQMELKSQ